MDRNTLRFASRMLQACLVIACLGTPLGAEETEQVKFTQDGQTRMILGRVVVEAQDGGILLEGQDQVAWPLQPDEIISRNKLDDSPAPITEAQLAKLVAGQLPSGFRVHKTAHYLIVYNTTREYAQWCGALFERLHRAFNNYLSRRGIKLEKTPPLVACIFRDKKSYIAYGRKEQVAQVQSTLGFYSYKTNRIAIYDLLEGRRIRNVNQINALLQRTERTVATVIHEATHQLAFNSGLHQRYADIPLWLSEGFAIFFETPDLGTSRGWRTIGAVNRVRLQQFREYAKRREDSSLSTLIASNDRFQRVGLATDAYAEAWAFCYFLMRRHPKDFADYLKIMQKKVPIVDDTPEQRLADFRNAFGKSPDEFNDDLLKQIKRL